MNYTTITILILCTLNINNIYANEIPIITGMYTLCSENTTGYKKKTKEKWLDLLSDISDNNWKKVQLDIKIEFSCGDSSFSRKQSSRKIFYRYYSSPSGLTSEENYRLSQGTKEEQDYRISRKRPDIINFVTINKLDKVNNLLSSSSVFLKFFNKNYHLASKNGIDTFKGSYFIKRHDNEVFSIYYIFSE